MSEQETVSEIIRKAKPGTIFVPADFADVGSDDSVRKALSRLSSVAATVVQALKALGKDGVTPDKLDIISSRLDNSQMESLERETRNATSWVRSAVKGMRDRRLHHA